MDFTIRRAGHVVLRVTDLMRAKAFLEDVVGFQTYGQEGSFYFLTANPVSNHHMIAVRSGKSGERLPDPCQIGMDSISYEVNAFDDLHRLYQRIKAQGPAFGATVVRTEDFGSISNLVIADHDGNHLEFYCRRNEGDGTDLEAAPAAEDPQRLTNQRSGIRRTSHLTLRCTDLPASRAFYGEMLHLVPIADVHGRTYLASAPDAQPVLALEQSADTNAPLPTPKKMFGMEHFSMELASFAQLQHAYRHLKSNGIDVHHTMDHGVTNSVYLIDPDGNLMEIYHDVPRAEYANPDNPFGSFGAIDDRLDAVPAV